MRTTAYGLRVCPACRGAAGLYDTACETCGGTGLDPQGWMLPEPPLPDTGTGHNSAQREPLHSRAVAALGELAYLLIQLGLLVAGIVLISVAMVAGAARHLLHRTVGGRHA
jgi:hypothetical protein